MVKPYLTDTSDMATIINSPNPNPTPNNESSSAGWVIAIILLVILGGLGVWYVTANQDTQTPPTETPEQQGTNTLPPPVNNFNTTINASSTINNSTTTNR